MSELTFNSDMVANNPYLERLYKDAQAAGFTELGCTEIISGAMGLLRNSNRDTWIERHPELHDLLKDLNNPSAWMHDWIARNPPADERKDAT